MCTKNLSYCANAKKCVCVGGGGGGGLVKGSDQGLEVGRG